MLENVIPLKSIVIIYHAKCPDGFGSAWVAFQKFGMEASYVPVKRGDVLPVGLEGKEVYILDFSYDLETLLNLESSVRQLVVIDHHISSENDVKGVKQHVFDIAHSGVYLTWQYFYPFKAVPRGIEYLSAGDIGAFNILPDQELLEFYLTSIPLTFEAYTKAMTDFESDDKIVLILEKATLLKEYQNKIVGMCYDSLHYVDFEGYIIPAVNATLPISETSQLLHKIYTEHNVPFALRYRYDDGEWKCSLRGTGEVDVSELAKRHGGGGHVGSAGFSVPAEFPLPFATLSKSDDIL